MKATRRKKFNIDALEPIIDKDIWPIVKAINDKVLLLRCPGTARWNVHQYR